MIVESSTPEIARCYVRLVLLLVELTSGTPMLDTPIEVRGIHAQGRLL